MRKMRGMLCGCVLLALLALPGWAGAASALTGEDFVFVSDGVSYHLGEAAAPLLAALGEMALLETESCLFDGTDKEYSNEALLVATYPIGPGGADVIETILVQAGEWTTARGIGVGAEKAAVEAVYGTDYRWDYDQMIYALGDPLTEPLLFFTIDLQTQCVTSFCLYRNTAG